MAVYKGRGTLQTTGRQLGKSLTAKALQTLMNDLLTYKLELHCEEGAIYGETYYCVRPLYADNKWDEMIAWMVEMFGACSEKKGPGVWTPGQRWYANNARFWFRDEADRTLFVMKWA